jgi:hypothetical protein
MEVASGTIPRVRLLALQQLCANAGRARPGLIAGAAALAFAAAGASAQSARGSVVYEAKGASQVVAPRYAYLLRGPDAVSGKPIRRVVLSVADLGATLRGCETMSCPDANLREGMTIDFDAGPRLNYWLVADGQRVQYSGTAEPGSLALSANTPQKLAGRWTLDARAAGGPRIEIEFDAPLASDLSRAR